MRPEYPWYYIAADSDEAPSRACPRFTLCRTRQWHEDDFRVGAEWCREQFGEHFGRWERRVWVILIYDIDDAMLFRLRFC